MSYKTAGNAKRYAGGDSPYYRIVVEQISRLVGEFDLQEVTQEDMANICGGKQIGIYTTSFKPGQSLRRAMDIAEQNGLVTKYRKHDPATGGLKVWYKLHPEYGQKPLMPGEYPL